MGSPSPTFTSTLVWPLREVDETDDVCGKEKEMVNVRLLVLELKMLSSRACQQQLQFRCITADRDDVAHAWNGIGSENSCSYGPIIEWF